MHFEIDSNSSKFDISDESSKSFEIPLERTPHEIPAESKVPLMIKDRGFDFINHSQFHRGPRNSGKGYKLVAWSFIAAVIDGLLIAGIGIFFMLSAHLLTHMSFFDVKTLVSDMPMLPFGLSGGVIFFYTSIQRVFMGHTIGEWACGLRLGQAKQRLTKYYGLRVCLRSILVLASGLFLFPILSALTGRDVLGRMLRLPLIQLDPGFR